MFFDPFIPECNYIPINPSRFLRMRRLIRRLVNILLMGLEVFAVVGSAACALRIVLSH